jgi:hypothetical protein
VKRPVEYRENAIWSQPVYQAFYLLNAEKKKLFNFFKKEGGTSLRIEYIIYRIVGESVHSCISYQT